MITAAFWYVRAEQAMRAWEHTDMRMRQGEDQPRQEHPSDNVLAVSQPDDTRDTAPDLPPLPDSETWESPVRKVNLHKDPALRRFGH
ncbi:MAG TPA: hypothetical protein VE338_18050 [Ktedonobacterales bacterium]|nr:hypothetical protein [Ktedonobacterales bacterium]